MGHIAITTFQPAANGKINREDMPIDQTIVGVRNILPNPKACRVPTSLREAFSKLMQVGVAPAMVHIVTRSPMGVERGKTILVPKQEVSKLQVLAAR